MEKEFKTRERPSAAPPEGKAAMFDQGDEQSIPKLVQRLADQGSHLAQQQMELVRAEMNASINELKEAAGAMAGAAVLGIASVGVLLMGVAFLLGEFMPLWAGTLITALLAVAGAYGLFAAGQKKIRSGPVSAERTRRTIERAPGAMAGEETKGENRDR